MTDTVATERTSRDYVNALARGLEVIRVFTRHQPRMTLSEVARATDLPKPAHARNMRLIGHSDQGGRSDGQQIMVRNGYAYIGHVCSRGFSVIDVRDPGRPRAVNYVENPPNTWSLHLQVHDDLAVLTHDG